MFLALSTGLSWPCSTNYHGGDVLQVKGLDPDQVPAGEGWMVALLTHKLAATSQNFVEISQTMQKFLTIL